MIIYKEIDQKNNISLVSKFNQASRFLGISVNDLYYDGRDFYKYIKEDDYYQQLLIGD